MQGTAYPEMQVGGDVSHGPPSGAVLQLQLQALLLLLPLPRVCLTHLMHFLMLLY